jgi:hypothetical protein
MSGYVEVSFIIVGDVNDDDIYNQIIETVKRMDDNNIITITHTSGTNTVYASANWNKSEIDKKLEQIRNIANVKNVSIDKENNFTPINIVENTIKISNHVSWDIVKDPINEINRAKDDGDYFKAITYSCTVFEYYGKQILLRHFKNAKTPVSKCQLKHLNLESVIIMLYTHNIIKETIYIKILEVKGLRNKFIHHDRAVKFSSQQIEQSKDITCKGLECIEFLKPIYDNI